MQTQNKSKGTQAMHAEQVERQHKQLPALFSQRDTIQTFRTIQRRVTKLTNVNIYIVNYASSKGKHGFSPLDWWFCATGRIVAEPCPGRQISVNK